MLLVLIAACGRDEDTFEAPATQSGVVTATSPIIPTPHPEPTHEHVILSSTRPDLDRAVADHARRARARGLVPVVHIATPWNSGRTLAKYSEDAEVVNALEGLYLIEIDYADICLEGACGRWATDVLCGTFAQTLYEVGRDGAPTDLSASPGKSGPETAKENGAMLEEFKALLMHPPAREERSSGPRCIEIGFSSHAQ